MNIPEGFKLVPDADMAILTEPAAKKERISIRRHEVQFKWRAVLAAAPVPPQGDAQPFAVFSIDKTGYRVKILESAMNSLPPDGAKLYTHADAGEVEPKGPLCFCGLKQTKNPHPEAGVPPGYLQVGTVYDCIPCLNKSRHEWSGRANKAEKERNTLRAQLDEQSDLLFQWLAMFGGGISTSMLGVLRESTRLALSATKEGQGDE